MEALPQGLQPLEALGGSLLGLFSRREAHEHQTEERTQMTLAGPGHPEYWKQP